MLESDSDLDAVLSQADSASAVRGLPTLEQGVVAAIAGGVGCWATAEPFSD
jgi:hypothetical protein